MGKRAAQARFGFLIRGRVPPRGESCCRGKFEMLTEMKVSRGSHLSQAPTIESILISDQRVSWIIIISSVGPKSLPAVKRGSYLKGSEDNDCSPGAFREKSIYFQTEPLRLALKVSGVIWRLVLITTRLLLSPRCCVSPINLLGYLKLSLECMIWS